MRKILSIDGGGIKGTIPAAFLAALERDLGISIREHFDLVVGTSTGGIIALGIGAGLPAGQILDFYVSHGRQIFLLSAWKRHAASIPWLGKMLTNLSGPRYDASALADLLENVFGNKTIGDSTVRLAIPAFDAKRRRVQVFKTKHHPKLTADGKVPMKDVAAATAAAPTLFRAHRLKTGELLVDGGLWANNPLVVGVVEGLCILNWDPADIAVLSLGCTEEIRQLPTSAGWWALKDQIADTFLQAQEISAVGMAKLLLRDSTPERRLIRIQLPVPAGTYGVDKADLIDEMCGLGNAEARRHSSQLNDLFFREKAEAFVAS